MMWGLEVVRASSDIATPDGVPLGTRYDHQGADGPPLNPSNPSLCPRQ